MLMCDAIFVKWCVRQYVEANTVLVIPIQLDSYLLAGLRFDEILLQIYKNVHHLRPRLRGDLLDPVPLIFILSEVPRVTQGRKTMTWGIWI